MKPRFLFPHNWRIAGYLLLLVSACLMGFNLYNEDSIFASTSINFSFLSSPRSEIINMINTDTIGLAVVIGLLLIGFSKEKIEDEQISQIRLESLQWAVYLNYIVFIICIIAVNGTSFLSVLLYNVITPLLFFCIRFRWKIYQSNHLLIQN